MLAFCIYPRCQYTFYIYRAALIFQTSILILTLHTTNISKILIPIKSKAKSDSGLVEFIYNFLKKILIAGMKSTISLVLFKTYKIFFRVYESCTCSSHRSYIIEINFLFCTILLRDTSSDRSGSSDTMPRREVIKATWNRIQTRRKSFIKCSVTLIKIPHSHAHSLACMHTHSLELFVAVNAEVWHSQFLVRFSRTDALR